jgi:OOP family OmpA-OmpF porin
MRLFLVGLVIVCMTPGVADAAPPPLPTADAPASADSPALKRFEGALILQYDKKNLDELTLPLSKLEPVRGKKASGNNNAVAPKKSKTVEGETTHLLYVMPAQRASLEILKHYRDEIQAQKGKLLYECKAAECGGNAAGNSLDGGGTMGMAMYLRSGERVTEKPWSIQWCASHEKLADVRYLAAELPATGSHVSVMTANLADVGEACSALRGRTIAVVDIVGGKRPSGAK